MKVGSPRATAPGASRVAKPSTRRFAMSRLTSHPAGAIGALVAVALLWTATMTRSAPASGLRAADGFVAEIVATGVVRPIQVAFDVDTRLVVLSHGRGGDTAGEVVWVDLRNVLPVDASPLPRVVIPFAEGRRIVFGSLAVDPRGGGLFVGEENGNRVYYLTREARLRPAAVGVHHLVGGSGMALDDHRRLVVLDFVSQDTQLRSESRPPSSLDTLGGDGYQGPLIFRVDLEPAASLPRRLDLVPPLFPRGWPRQTGQTIGRFISVTPLASDELAVLDSLGEIFVLDRDGALRPLARLPAGHYHRTNMAVAPNGSLLVSSGFHIRKIYQVTPAGSVSIVASDLGDPAGIAVDRQGRLYVAETALHRIIRIAPAR